MELTSPYVARVERPTSLVRKHEIKVRPWVSNSHPLINLTLLVSAEW
jgi:hypothetical protein